MGKEVSCGCLRRQSAPVKCVEWQVSHIKWFYRKLLDNIGSGPINPAESSMVKDTLKV